MAKANQRLKDEINNLESTLKKEQAKHDKSSDAIQEKTGKLITKDPVIISETGMTTDGLQAVHDYVSPNLDERTQKSCDKLYEENKDLRDQIDELQTKIREIDTDRCRYTDGGLDDLENQYLENLRDV